MSKKISLLLVVVMLLSVFVACGQKTNEKAPEAETPVETTEEATEEAVEEEYVPSVESVKVEGVEVGSIAKIGLGANTSISSSKDAGDNPARAQADVTIAAVSFDAEGRIIEAKIDVAQSKADFTEDHMSAVIPEEFKTKMELGPEYGMLKASPIGKEFDEQMSAFCEYIVGMTAEEVVNIPTRVMDEHHPNVPDVADILTSTTMDIGAFVVAVGEAWDTAIDAEGATKLGLGIETNAAVTDGAADKATRVQFNTYMNALALNDEGQIVANIIDVVQARVEADAEGKIVERITDVRSKKELGEEYGMKDYSEIGKDWYEQMAAWEEFTLGKTVEEVQGIPVKERDAGHKHVPDLAELTSSVTITVEGYQSVMGKAEADANK